MLWGVPPGVKRFFAPAVREASKPIRGAVSAMVLAFLLAPHYRRLKTIAGMVAGHRVHVATISRRLANSAWTTRDWYVTCADQVLAEASRLERSLGGNRERTRKFTMILDTTYHASVGETMENLIVMSKRKDPRRRNTRQHVFVMGLLITESGARIPLPRRSYYTQEYCKAKKKKYKTQNQLAQLMIRTAPIPANADVTVVFDSAFDADAIHGECRKRGFREVFPIDPNRNLATTDAPHARAKAGAPVVASTLEWNDQEFETLELECEKEDFVLLRRRHVDNLRVKKTYRKYVYAARRLAVSKLGNCVIVASYKENPKIELLPGESGDWKDYRRELAERRKKDRKTPCRWHAKVLACTDPNVTAREVIQWYEVRWHIETFFRELKSRMQLGCYVLMKFEAVERYLDLLLMGFVFLEMQRLRDLRAKNVWPQEKDPHSHWRVTDRLRSLEHMIQRFNLEYVRARIGTKRGQAELLARLEQSHCQVA